MRDQLHEFIPANTEGDSKIAAEHRRLTVACGKQCTVAALEHQPLLRVHRLSLRRRYTKGLRAKELSTRREGAMPYAECGAITRPLRHVLYIPTRGRNLNDEIACGGGRVAKLLWCGDAAC